MALQMYIVTFRNGYSDAASRDVQRKVRDESGFILMVTKSGVIVGLDEARVNGVQRSPDVGMVSGVSFNPRGYAADRLQRIFAENMAKQFTVET